MLVMSDVDDVFLPKPNDLLVNLTECRAAVESLLGRLNDMFADNHAIGSALGPALQSGFKLIVRFLPSCVRSRLTYIWVSLESHWW
jgi:protein transport protein SEC24